MFSDEATRKYYQTAEVVHEYDQMRFADRGGALLRRLQEQAFLKALPIQPGPTSRVLDVGCGTGRFLETLAPSGCRLVGLDASLSMIATARQRVPSAELVLGDALEIPFEDDAFDLAYTVWVINHMTQYADVVTEMCRVSRSVLIVVPSRRSLFSLTPLFKRLGGPRLFKKESAMGLSRHAEPPFSMNFAASQITDVLRAHGFLHISVQRSVLLPLIPNAFAGWYPKVERLMRPVCARFGTFMAISASKERGTAVNVARVSA
jgi:SAM-dependent methyltransferase